MNTKLKDSLCKYRDITLELIRSVENEDYDCLETLITNRQDVIKFLGDIEYNREEFRNICDELRIVYVQDKLNKLMNLKKVSLKNALESISNNRQAQKSYNKRFSNDSIFFNKKI